MNDQDFRAFLVLGPRQTGKTYLIREQLKSTSWIINLLDTKSFVELTAHPEKMREIYLAKVPRPKLIVVDEIQRVPELLSEVHLMLEEYDVRFLLTGSSARKLKRQNVNLLGGRLRKIGFHPLIFSEFGDHFDLVRALSYGGLPTVVKARSPLRVLDSYVGTYLKDEIAAEGFARSLPAFSRFLTVAAIANGSMLSYSGLANDAQIPKTTLIEHFSVLKDTLIIHELPAFQETLKRKPIETSKFYFFDIGVANYLAGRRSLLDATFFDAGTAFENWIHHELRSFIDYNDLDLPLTYWRSQSQFEVDFILGHSAAIEVKATSSVNTKDLKGLRAFREEGIAKHHILVCRESAPRVHDGILILPWDDFLSRLWNRDFC